ncbi:uncharacterized protein [Euphorbia lathyris]|uniref:uncharacterized protein isoform X2 n=1 Tax=Euphorbia lathyris TaxID=212925 RepID=UPI0033131895
MFGNIFSLLLILKLYASFVKVLSCAALLDPRYKEKFPGYCYTKIYGKDNALSYVAKVVGNLHALFEEYKNSDSKTIQAIMCLRDWLKAQDEGNLMGPEETDSSSEDDEELDVDSEIDGGFLIFSRHWRMKTVEKLLKVLMKLVFLSNIMFI